VNRERGFAVRPDDSATALAARLDDALDRLAGLRLGDGFDPAVPAALVAAGLHLAPVPIDEGGLGIGLSQAVDLLAALGGRDGSTALGLAMHIYVVGSMAESDGWPAGQRERLYAAIRGDGALLNSAATEDVGGSPARGAVPATVAEPEPGPDGGFRLTGEKSWTTWLPALRHAIVTARIGGGARAGAARARSASPEVGIFVVDLEAPGVTRLPAFEALGMRGSASGRLRLDGVRVPADRLVVRRPADRPDPRGPAPGAWFAMAVGAVYLGVGEGARRDVVRWAVDRRPGDGSTAVADLPTVQVRLGRLDAALRTARIALLDVARRWDAAAAPERADLMADVVLAKLMATTAAADATDEALRIAGGPGFLDGPLERAFRDARAGLINPPLEDVALAGFARTLVEGERSGRLGRPAVPAGPDAAREAPEE
jgi:alkylation response protein AidB-like acyl-CoA dehydrogenase